MSVATNWMDYCVFAPFPPAIGGLPDSYPWARLLSGVNVSVLYNAMLQPIRGAVFTGPAGNGKHTQAFAFAYSLLEKKVRFQGDFSKALLILIDPVRCPVNLPEQELLGRVDQIYAAMNEWLEQDSIECAAIVFDQLELYPQSMMDRIADAVENLEEQGCFTIGILEDETLLTRKLKRQLMHCRCLAPNKAQREQYLKQELTFEIVDNWTDELSPKKKTINIDFEGITFGEVADLTDGFAYADMEDLVRLLKLLNANMDTRELDKPTDVTVHQSRADVLGAIELCRPQREKVPAAAASFDGQAILAQVLSQQTAILSSQHAPAVRPPVNDLPEEMDIEAGIALINSI